MPTYNPPPSKPNSDLEDLFPSTGQAVAVGVLIAATVLASRGRITPTVGTFITRKAKESAVGIGMVGFSQISDHYEKTLQANPTQKNIENYLNTRESPSGKYIYAQSEDRTRTIRIPVEAIPMLLEQGFIRRAPGKGRTGGKVEMAALWNADP